jgi:hypothetical protein
LEDLKNTKIIINSIKVTQNGNLLVYPGSVEDKKMLIEKNLLFPESQSCDLEMNKKNLQLLVKGINAENFELRYNSNLIQNHKISQVIEIKKKDGTVLNMCKIEMETKDEFEGLLHAGNIKIGLYSYKVEKIARSPLMCHNCKEYGHSLKSCNKQSRCAKCGKNSHENECDANVKCLHCGNNHSCYFKGCSTYKDLMKKEIESDKERVKEKQLTMLHNKDPNNVPIGFIRNYSDTSHFNNNKSSYSAAVNPIGSITNQINLKFNELSKQLLSTVTDSLKNQIITSVNEMKKELQESVSSLIVKNNDKMVHFILDVIRTILPETIKPVTMEVV